MKKIFTSIALLLFTSIVLGQVRVTPEGYPLLPKKPSIETLVDNDSIMAQKDDGILRAISFGDFKNLLPFLNSYGIDPVTQAEYDLLTPTEIAENDYAIVDESTGSVGGVITDGDKGDIDVSNGGTLWTISTGAVTSTKIANGQVGSLQIADNIIKEQDLNITNSPTDNYLLSYNAAGTNFTWVDPSNVGASAADGSETKINAGTNVSITGNGTTGSPYVINSTDTNTQLSDEQVQDKAGAMWTGNTESGASVNYQDGDGTMDITVNAGTSNIQDGAVTEAKMNSSFYEEIGISPTLVDLGGGATYTHSTTSTCTRIGRKVFFTVFFTGIGTSGTPSGILAIDGLPLDATYSSAVDIASFDGSDVDFYSIYGTVVGTEQITFKAMTSLGEIPTSPISSVTFSAGRILVSGSYTTNQ